MEADVHWSEAEGNPYQMSGKAWVGQDAIVQNLFMKLGTEWDAFTVHPKEFHDAATRWSSRDATRGSTSSTGKSADAQFCHVFKIRNGKLASFQQFVDTAQMQDVMEA